MNRSIPTRKLPERPDLSQLKRQAKELFDGFLAGQADAVAEVARFYRDADRATFALHDAQLTLARSYGYDSWPKLKAFVDGVNIQRLLDTVQSGDVEQVRALLRIRPELVNGEVKGHTALHYAVLGQMPEMIRVLMAAGANAHAGIYPNTDATTPLSIADERGYDDIAALIREEEQRREVFPTAEDQVFGELRRALRAGDEDQAIGVLVRHPELIQFRMPGNRRTVLHLASALLFRKVAAWLLDHGADVGAKTEDGSTPLDVAGMLRDQSDRKLGQAAMVELLLNRGAKISARGAVILGDEKLLRELHASVDIVTPRDEDGWLLRLAVDSNRPEILKLLLDFGLDPDARVRAGESDDIEFTWGMPLYECVRAHRHDMAEMLLERGADPNGAVYASGTPLSEAYGQRDEQMIALLERFGGKSNPSMAGLYRRKDLALRLLAEHGDAYLPDDGFGKGTVAEQLIGSAARGGDPEILRLGMDRVDWPHGDPRWHGALGAPLGFWNHWIGPWCHLEWDRGTYLACFKMILERVDDPNRRIRFGMTILHNVVTMSDHVTADERVAFATALLDAGARMDLRDDLLKSTPLGWACRWGREELVRLFLDRGADPVEPDAEPWATPLAWATKKGHQSIVAMLRPT